MKQLTLFDDYGPILKIEEKTMTWLDLYNFLHTNANNLSKINDMSRFWNQSVVVHDIETGDEYACDTLILDESKLVISINNE